ncbi:MAG: ABATE domain-containing protein [Candidatus Sulfotelmatobacter sp.]
MPSTKPNAKPSGKRVPRFELLGGPVCLDFINTLDDRSTQPKELLKSYNDLLHFCADAGLLPARQVDDLVVRSYGLPEQAKKTLQSAIEMREAMFTVFSAIMKKQSVPRGALAQLNGFIQEAAQHMCLVQTNGRFTWEFARLTSPEYALDPVLWPIARSAADLLASDQLPFVRACESETCRWLFLDTSKNHRRQWCDMTKCGNRAKARRFYVRQKQAEL